MIKSIRLQNFFSFRDETIEFNPDINVLVGINGSGKSNVFKAIELLKYALSGADLKPLIIDEWGGVGAIEHSGINSHDPIIIIYTLGDHSTSINKINNENGLTYLIQIERRENGLFFISESIDIDFTDFRIKITKDKNSLVNCDLWVNDHGTSLLHAFYEDEAKLTSIFSQIPSWNYLDRSNLQIRELISLKRRFTDYVDVYDAFQTQKNAELRKPVYATAAKKLSKSGGNLAQVLNFLKDEHQRNYLKIEKALENINENFSGLDYSSLGGYMELKLREKRLNRSIPLAHISDGTLRYTCLLAILCNPERGFSISIDEPEQGLHPDMIRGLFELMADSATQSQLIISTHSLQLLDYTNLEQLIIIEKDDNNSSFVRRLKESDFEGQFDEFYPGQMWLKGFLGGVRW